MKKKEVLIVSALILALVGCAEKEASITGIPVKQTFMFWCFRKEIVSDDFFVPDMSTQAKAVHIQNRLKGVPGYEGSSFDLKKRRVSVRYQSSLARKMNFEEAIALAGFAVDYRPPHTKDTLPKGIY